ncbi:hypothetical protein [Sphingobium aquiterrae]|uniref:hypothetical protein n=1 Tax=Sphingobium aquiterrae TaxID=2038656 RepID=UPI00301739AC
MGEDGGQERRAPVQPGGREMETAAAAKRRPRITAEQKDSFFTALIDTSCVTAAAQAAGIDRGHIYRLRIADADFRARWDVALLEGYQLLEMDMLAWARRMVRGEDAAEESRAVAVRERDVAAAMRLLGMHRARVAEIEARLEALRGKAPGRKGARSGDEVAQLLRAQLLEARARLKKSGAAVTAGLEHRRNGGKVPASPQRGAPPRAKGGRGDAV